MNYKNFRDWFTYWELTEYSSINIIKDYYRSVINLWWAAFCNQWICIGVAALLGNPMEFGK